MSEKEEGGAGKAAAARAEGERDAEQDKFNVEQFEKELKELIDENLLLDVNPTDMKLALGRAFEMDLNARRAELMGLTTP